MSETNDEGATAKLESANASIPVVDTDDPGEGEPPQDEVKRLPRPIPVRVQLNFEAVANLERAEDVLQKLEWIGQVAEEEGLFFTFSLAGVMDDDEVRPNTPLARALGIWSDQPGSE